MKKRIVLVFETLAKGKDIVRRLRHNFYPAGSYWIIAFSNGEVCLEMEDSDKLSDIDPKVFGVPDLILVKDAKLKPEEWDVLAKIVNGNDLYIIYHYSSSEWNKTNSEALQAHEQLRQSLRGAITQSHLDGEFYHEELVGLLECVLSEKPEIKERYPALLQQLILNKFPDPILEAKLDLLHKCLELEGAKGAELPELLKAQYAKEFDIFREGINETNHLKKLSRLRDVFFP